MINQKDIQLYNDTTLKISKLVTKRYSSSFSLGIYFFNKKLHNPIYALYGFVRFADEIVDTFYHLNCSDYLESFKKETFDAIKNKVSFNPIIHSFQLIVNQYNIDIKHIEAFIESMEMDISKKTFNQQEYEKYIYGSAEVIGLMCLKIFCDTNTSQYESLKNDAQKLGAAFQKVNFLRDITSDYVLRKRVYFPNVSYDNFSEKDKNNIIYDIQKDFTEAQKGVLQLPKNARLGVLLAFTFYQSLLKKIQKVDANNLKTKRIRIPNYVKFMLLLKVYIFSK